MVQIISAFAAVVSSLINLTDDLAKLGPHWKIILAVEEYFSFHFLSDFDWSEALLCFDGFSNETSCLNFDAHEFHDVDPFKSAPAEIELEEVLFNFNNDEIDINTNWLLSDFSIEVPETMF